MRTPAVTALVLLAAVAALAGFGPRAAPNPKSCLDDGDRKTKLTLIEHLARNPQIVILGSSRARPASPAYLRQLTGLTAFNGGVRGGSPSDAWVMTRLIAKRFPGAERRYLYFDDVGIGGNGVNPELAMDPRARPYLGDDASAATSTCHLTSTYGLDGSLTTPPLSAAAQAARVKRTVVKLVASIEAHPPQPSRIDPANMTYFERTIAFMNQEGARPVIVLNPIHPTVLATLRRYGFPARQAADAYLTDLRKRLDFVLVDCEDIRTWHGSAAHFYDATHIDRTNMQRLLAYVVSHSDGALG